MNKELDVLKQTIWDKKPSLSTPIIPRIGQGGRITRHKNGISGCVCVFAGLLLLLALILKSKEAFITEGNLTVWITLLIITLYCLTKGIFTLFFYRKERHYEVSVHQFAVLSVHNQLFFLYERMLWLWLLLPILIGTIPTIIFLLSAEDIGTTIYWSVSAIVYVTMLLVCSRPLLRKYRKLRKELEEMQE